MTQPPTPPYGSPDPYGQYGQQPPPPPMGAPGGYGAPVPGGPFFAVDPAPNTLRLAYSLLPPADIDEGVRRLGRLIEGRLAYAGSNAARAATGRA